LQAFRRALAFDGPKKSAEKGVEIQYSLRISVEACDDTDMLLISMIGVYHAIEF
jgi:hypothetical protein